MITALALIVALALGLGMSALVGLGSAWVLAHFGVHVAWYVCSVAIFIIGTIFKAGAK